MLQKIKNLFTRSLRLSVASLLLVSTNQTTSVAGNSPHPFQQKFSLSESHTIEISSLKSAGSYSSKRYRVRVYSRKAPKLISAMTRPLTGHISEAFVEDINDDGRSELIILMEGKNKQNNKKYLIIDTFSFDGKNMLWKQKLPSNFVSVKANSYLNKHETPSNMARSTALLELR